MRRRLATLLVLLLAPAASAEFGRYDEHGYPINVDGEPTFPGGLVPGALGPVNVVGPLTVYPYYPVLTAEVQRLASEHLGLVKLHSAGKSTAGLDLWMLEIADFENPDMVPLEEREVVWVDGGTHSNEYSGVYFVAHLASFLLDGYATNETAKWIVEHRHTWLMPMVNPDGSNAFGRLNARLVNINRNYPVVWDGAGHDELMNNRGPEPASEVETRANIEWLNKTRPDYYASVHCCGNLWLYPYGEEGVDPVDNATFARVCAEAFPSVGDKCGPIWSTIYPASGSSVDTAYEYAGAVAFGYEMSGRGALALWGQPFTMDDVETQEAESWQGVMHALLNVHRYGGHPVVAAARVEGRDLVLTIANDGYGNLTRANVTIVGQGYDDGTMAGMPGITVVPIAHLAPGERIDVRAGGAFRAGEMSVEIAYAKREIGTAAVGRLESIVELQDSSGGLRAVRIDDRLLVSAAPQAPADVPFLGLAVVLGVLVAVALRRR